MRRTVNDAPAPSPRLRMTTPSKACSRSFSPSMTLTDTRTVSPGTNPCRSFFSSPASTIRIASMMTISSLDKVGRQPALTHAVHPFLFFGRQVRRLQEIGPALPRPPHGPQTTPARDSRVVSRDEDVRHREPAEHLGAGVLRMLEQPAGERVVGRRAVLAQHPRQEARHGLRDDEGRELTAGQHVVADRQLLVHEVKAHPLVYALVPTAH